MQYFDATSKDHTLSVTFTLLKAFSVSNHCTARHAPLPKEIVRNMILKQYCLIIVRKHCKDVKQSQYYHEFSSICNSKEASFIQKVRPITNWQSKPKLLNKILTV